MSVMNKNDRVSMIPTPALIAGRRGLRRRQQTGRLPKIALADVQQEQGVGPVVNTVTQPKKIHMGASLVSKLQNAGGYIKPLGSGLGDTLVQNLQGIVALLQAGRDFVNPLIEYCAVWFVMAGDASGGRGLNQRCSLEV